RLHAPLIELTKARIIAEGRERVIIDEFTSVVDRQIAKIGAGAFSKAWKRGGGQAVLLSCHYDVLDWNYTVAVNAKK
ncbi:MAG TPA: hypothetical protein PK225_14770, partial [Azonexus sp.]|nr:hypothetical protein [Azonexus sp.]